MSLRSLTWVVCCLVACGDSGADPMPMDGALEQCTDNSECDDGVFCSGVEVCDPDRDSADSFGCVAGPPRCGDDETCNESEQQCERECVDGDGDGALPVECGGTDCDDTNADRFPGNTEVCDADNIDEDCDPTTVGSLDADGDGAISDTCCNDDNGTLTCGQDCDDARANVSGLASEACDLVDNDCDGSVDEGVLRAFHADSDGDSFGDPDGATMSACNPPAGFVEDDTDCNDDDRNVNPVAAERCMTGIDEDCDGETDEMGEVRYYADEDEDGFGNLNEFMDTESCEPPMGYVAIAGDCNDDSAAHHPGADDYCDGQDTDCNLGMGSTDPAEDMDGDEHAAVDATCEVGDAGFGSYPRDDCDDAAPTVYSGAPELCDRRDTACTTDGGVLASEDVDGDNHAATNAACSGGFSRDDCDDNDANTYLGAPELCDRLDNDCSDGGGVETDEDVDDDGHAPVGAMCTGGFARDDCQDTEASIYPGAPELCDRLDNDCSDSGGVDPSEDADDDGFAPIGATCSAGPRPATDCDDNAPDTYPGAPETCDGDDQDCDTESDSVDADAHSWCGPFAGCDVNQCHIEGPVAAIGGDGLDGASFAVRGSTGFGWGSEPYAGISTSGTMLSPTALAGLDDIDSIRTGPANSCAVASNGQLWCWGYGESFSSSQLDAPTMLTLDDVLEVSLGSDTACARVDLPPTQDDEIYCWGENFSGALGDTTPRAMPTVLSLSSGLLAGGPRQLVAGSRHHCALEHSGQVVCWGVDNDGELGRGTVPDPVTDQLGEPDLVSNLTDAASIAAGGRYTCAVRRDGTVTCWGSLVVGTGIPGDGFELRSNLPQAIAGLTDVRQIAIGGGHLCALLNSGSVECLGDNSMHQLGDGTADDSMTPVDVVGVTDARFIAAGAMHTCVLRDSGGVMCWGGNSAGQLGDGTTNDAVPHAVQVDDITDATGVAALDDAFCATTGGGLMCWGRGPVGDGTGQNRPSPVAVLTGANAIDAATSTNAHCMLNSGGTVACWGNGALGTGGAPTNTPTAVPGVSDAVVIGSGTGAQHACVAGPSGLQCWGNNGAGQLGSGDTMASAMPATSGFALGTIAALGLGFGHTCVASGGAVSCFGAGALGVLGDGNGTNSLTPVNASGITTATLVVTGNFHNCALLADQTVQCWGFNQWGMLGDGTTDQRNSPVAVGGLDNVIGLSASLTNTCAVRTAGDVRCWGDNTNGRAGNPSIGSVLTSPTSVTGVSNANDVAINGLGGCASTSSGTVMCWGFRSILGQAALANPSSTPVAVVGLP